LGTAPVINRGALAAAIAAGPACTAAAQGLSYIAAAVGCGTTWTWLTLGVPATAFAIVAGSLVWLVRAAGGAWQRHDDEPPEIFAARLGVGGNIFFLMVLLAFHLPRVYFHGCD
jgi:hypothetical protein